MAHPALHTVDAMLRASRAFSEIEDYIDEQELPEDLKSALWLFAWSEQPRATRRATVLLPELLVG